MSFDEILSKVTHPSTPAREKLREETILHVEKNVEILKKRFEAHETSETQ
ncbi:MAG: hypothetical protein ACI4UE_05170 [Candidatus Scatovivens sp.]